MLKDALEKIRVVAETLDENDPDKLEMLNVEGDYSALMEWAIKKRTESLAMETANKELTELYKNRAARFGNKAEGMKDILGYIMDCANEKSYKGASGTVTKKQIPPKPIVADENKIPDEYFITERKLDKVKLNAAIKDGASIDGVSLSNGGETVTIRIK